MAKSDARHDIGTCSFFAHPVLAPGHPQAGWTQQTSRSPTVEVQVFRHSKRSHLSSGRRHHTGRPTARASTVHKYNRPRWARRPNREPPHLHTYVCISADLDRLETRVILVSRQDWGRDELGPSKAPPSHPPIVITFLGPLGSPGDLGELGARSSEDGGRKTEDGRRPRNCAAATSQAGYSNMTAWDDGRARVLLVPGAPQLLIRIQLYMRGPFSTSTRQRRRRLSTHASSLDSRLSTLGEHMHDPYVCDLRFSAFRYLPTNPLVLYVLTARARAPPLCVLHTTYGSYLSLDLSSGMWAIPPAGPINHVERTCQCVY
ncbi:hypothetical protein C8Q80DRAFT_130704 [Daedaleopsis nitida]|nr:hypothetical protein C8Q80DRAFT_130704 [Daedaleopsis nitida]